MAFTRDYLQATTQKHIVPRLADGVFIGCPFAWYLRENHSVKLAGGEAIVQPILYREGTAEWWDRVDVADLSVIEPEQSAKFDWKWLRVLMVIPDTDVWKNSGPDGKINLLAAREQHAELTLIENLSDGLMGTNASNSKQIDGLQDLYAASGTSYGDLLDTDFDDYGGRWLSQIISPVVGGTLTPTELRRMRGAATFGSRTRPNLALCNQSVFNKIWALAENDQRFSTERTASIGFEEIRFEGMPIVVDNHVAGSGYGNADNHIYMLNMDHIQFYVHQDVAFMTRVYEPTPAQNVYVAGIYLGCNLTTDNRRCHSVIKTINPSL